ncbi:MAG: hydrolase [Planctomycetota bacterium]
MHAPARFRPANLARLGCLGLVAIAAALAHAPAHAQTDDGPGHPELWAPGGTKERLTPDNCVFLFIDHQSGLMNLVDNVDTVNYRNYVLGLADAAITYDVPVILTTSDELGPNGPMIPEILERFPDAPLISRPGQINAWDNAEFVAAVEATGRKKLVVSGITTDVCVAFVTLSALQAGYEVYVVVDASGTMNQQVQDAAIMRMAMAGAEITNWFAVACELLSDWRNPSGYDSFVLFSKYLPAYGEVAASHAAERRVQE